MLKVSDIIQIKIDKIVFGGEGLGYYNGFAVFVPMSIPEDELEIEIISVKKTYARGLIKNIIKASPERVDSHKLTFEDFYGCDFAMLKYESQLKYKRLMVEEVMKKIAGLSDIQVNDVLASEDIYNYRNKIIEPFSVYANKIITGFFKRKSHEVFEVDENILNKIIPIREKKIDLKNINIKDIKTIVHYSDNRGLSIKTTMKPNDSEFKGIELNDFNLYVSSKDGKNNLSARILTKVRGIPENIALSVENKKDNTHFYKIEKNDGRNWTCGYKKKSLLAGYPHISFYSNIEFFKYLLEKL